LDHLNGRTQAKKQESQGVFMEKEDTTWWLGHLICKNVTFHNLPTSQNEGGEIYLD
jgi:hypothetical protein